ncbi:hypothetical protein ACWEQL_35790 [Kitasatospora sp. NPDC004240]
MKHPRFLIVSRPARADRQPGGTVWRLLGANNRHLGQSGETFRDAAACRAAIEEYQHRLDQGRAVMCSTGQGWLWRLELDGRAVAGSARGYLRQRECQYNLARFLAGARTVAELAAAARLAAMAELAAVAECVTVPDLAERATAAAERAAGADRATAAERAAGADRATAAERVTGADRAEPTGGAG